MTGTSPAGLDKVGTARGNQSASRGSLNGEDLRILLMFKDL